MVKRKNTPRAGFIPYYIERGTVYVMLMKPSDPKYGGGEFQIAKGHVDPGEDNITAAMREANEELGLRKDNVVSVEYLGNFLGYTAIYYGKVKNKDNFDKTTYETGATTWMTVNKFLNIGRGLHKPIIKAFADKVKWT